MPALDPTIQQYFSADYFIRAAAAGYTETIVNRDRSVAQGWIASGKAPNGTTVITARGDTAEDAQRLWCQKAGV